VALEVAVVAHSLPFESGEGTFKMSFLTESLFGGGAIHACCFVSLFVGVADAATNIGVGWGRSRAVFTCFESRTDMHVFMEDEVVEVLSLADIDTDFLNIELLGYQTLLETEHKIGRRHSYLAQPAQRS
jgi:hypothetical protein